MRHTERGPTSKAANSWHPVGVALRSSSGQVTKTSLRNFRLHRLLRLLAVSSGQFSNTWPTESSSKWLKAGNDDADGSAKEVSEDDGDDDATDDKEGTARSAGGSAKLDAIASAQPG